MNFFSRLLGKSKSYAKEKETSGAKWGFREAKAEQGDLVSANEVGWEDLKEINVYRVLPLQGHKIGPGGVIVANGTLTCSVCQKKFPVDFQVSVEGFLDAPSKHTVRCTGCSSITGIVGLTTAVKREVKYWLLVYRETGPAGAFGRLPQLEIERLAVNVQG